MVIVQRYSHLLKIHLFRTLRRCIVQFRVHRKRKAADMIYNFLVDLQDVNRIVQVIRRFRFWGKYFVSQ